MSVEGRAHIGVIPAPATDQERQDPRVIYLGRSHVLVDERRWALFRTSRV